MFDIFDKQMAFIVPKVGNQFFKNVPFPASFSGFDPRTSGVGSDHCPRAVNFSR